MIDVLDAVRGGRGDGEARRWNASRALISRGLSGDADRELTGGAGVGKVPVRFPFGRDVRHSENEAYISPDRFMKPGG